MELHSNVSLAELTTLRLGGVARFYTTVQSIEELREAIAYAHQHSLPLFFLGGGSNVCFGDAGWDGLVVRMNLQGRDYTEDTRGDAQAIVASGENWDTLVADSVSQGFWGLENLSYIPGTVGASPVQNVGAYGVSVADQIDWVEVLDIDDNQLHILSNQACAFGYRDSIFKHGSGRSLVVTRVAFRLYTKPMPRLAYKDLARHFHERTDVAPADVRAALKDIRGKKFPDLHAVGTAGSFFKNPIVKRAHHAQIESWLAMPVPAHDIDEEYVKVPLAWLLERLGWRGVRHGNVGTWKEHALVLVHYGGAHTDELLRFANEIMADVRAKTAIRIEPEVSLVGMRSV